MAVAQSRRDLGREQPRRRVVGQRRQEALQQRCLHARSFARRLPPEEREQDALEGGHPRQHVHERSPDLERGAIG